MSEPRFVIRELASSEYSVFANIPPFDQMGLPDPASSRVLVAQDAAGSIVGYWFLHAALHVEPFWLAPEARSQHLAKKMWDGIREMMKQGSAKVAYGIISDEDLVTAGMARRLGFQRVPGGLYFVTTEEAKKGNGHATFEPPPEVKES